MSALRELAVLLGIEVEGEQNLKRADEKVGSLLDKLRKVGEVVAEAFAWRQVQSFVQEQVQFGVELERSAQMLGLTTQALETYKFAAGAAGVEAEAMTTGLRHLNFAIGGAASGSKEHQKVFDELKIKLQDATGKTKPLGDIMGELADKIAATPDPAKKTEIAMELLGRQGAALIPVFNRGSAAFTAATEAMGEFGGPTSKEFIDSAKKIQEQELLLSFGFERLKQTLAVALFPAFSKLVDYATRWVKSAIDFAKHTTILETGLTALAVVASFKTATSLFGLAQKMGLIKPTALETVAALGRFAVPLIIITALYLIFDELFNFLKGNQSVIGDVLDEFGGLGTAEDDAIGLNDALNTLIDTLKDLGKIAKNTFGGFLDALDALDDQTNSWNDQTLEGQASSIAEFQRRQEKPSQNIREAWTDLTDSFSRVHDSPTRRALVEKRNYRRSYQAGLDEMGPGFSGPIYVPRSQVMPPGAQPAAAAPAGPATVIHQQNHNEVKITTASDKPAKVGEAAQSGVASGVQKANNNAWNAPAVRKL